MMRVLRTALIAGLALSFLASAPTADASEPPRIGCGGGTVEICLPTCVQAPCPQYVCVHTDFGSVCRVISE
jgi:hypothetical protein